MDRATSSHPEFAHGAGFPTPSAVAPEQSVDAMLSPGLSAEYKAGEVSSPRATQPDLVSSSDQYALRFSSPAGRYLLDRQALGVRRLIALTGASRMRVLDVGGGHMQLAPLFASMGHCVVVHGSSAEALGRVKEYTVYNAPALEMRVGGFFPLPATDEEFDMVISIRMLGHVGRWQELLREQCRASRRFVAVEFANAGGFQRLSRSMFRFKRLIEGDTRHFTTYAISDVVRELAKNGFHLVALDRQLVLPIVFHRILQRPGVSRSLETLLERAGLRRRIGSPVILLAARAPDSALAARVTELVEGRG